jgi:DNA repair photolyase
MEKLKVLYKPKGKAAEYAQNAYAANLYRGCGHGCVDCYAPAVIRLNREEFNGNPQPRQAIINKLRQDAKVVNNEHILNMKHWKIYHEGASTSNFLYEPKPKNPEVFMSFTTDPYQPINADHQLTRQAIEILHENEIVVNILTKGMITDFDLLAKRPDLSKVGVTLTNVKQADSIKWEPEAAMPADRCRNLQNAKDYGIFTWVSLEPARNLQSVKTIIDYTHEYVDHYKLGKWNYDPRAKGIDWHEFVNEVIELFDVYGCDYYIKDDLKQYIK